MTQNIEEYERSCVTVKVDHVKNARNGFSPVRYIRYCIVCLNVKVNTFQLRLIINYQYFQSKSWFDLLSILTQGFYNSTNNIVLVVTGDVLPSEFTYFLCKYIAVICQYLSYCVIQM